MSDSPQAPEPSKALADAAAAVFEAAQVPTKHPLPDVDSARALGLAAAALARAAEALALASKRAAEGGSPTPPSEAGTAPAADAPVEAKEEKPAEKSAEEAAEEAEAALTDEERRERRRLRAAVPTGAMDDPMLHLPPGDLPAMPPKWLERFIKPTDLLSPREETIRAAKIYFRVKLALAFVVLLVIGLLSARPLSRTIKTYQANRLAAAAGALMDEGNWTEGTEKAIAAYQLRPTESAVIRANARALTQVKDARGLELWEQLRERKELSDEDLRRYAGLASATGRLAQAEQLLRELLARPTGGTVADRTAELWVLALRGERERAGQLGQQLLADARAQPAERVNIAALLTDYTLPPYQEDGWTELQKHLDATDDRGLAALTQVAKRAIGDAAAPKAEVERLVQLLKAHPRGGVNAWLLAANLSVRHLGLSRETAVDEALGKFGRNPEDRDTVILARWLVALGEFERALEVVPQDVAARRSELASIHVSALRGLGKWKEIRQLILSERIPLSAYEADLQLAIATSRLGEQTAAARRWKKLSDAVSGNAQAVIALARTAEESGAPDVAEPLYRDATKLAPLLRGGWDGLLRATEARSDTAELVAVLNAARRALPNDRQMRLNWAHATALVGRDLDEARKVVEGLIAEGMTGGLPSVTLALICVRQGKPDEARAALAPTPLGDLKTLDGKSFTPSQLVVAAAVLAASDQMKEAKQLAEVLAKSTLRREEKDIVQRILEK